MGAEIAKVEHMATSKRTDGKAASTRREPSATPSKNCGGGGERLSGDGVLRRFPTAPHLMKTERHEQGCQAGVVEHTRRKANEDRVHADAKLH